MNWQHWIRTHWSALTAGNKLYIPQSEIMHPGRCPLFTAGLGFPDGQTCDYMMPINDGSRIHVQCFTSANGVASFRVHRDRWNPDRDLASFVLHALFETPVGPALTGLVVLAVFAR